MAMLPDSVTFELWRQGAGSADNYAVMTSTTGFASGQQLVQAAHSTVGSGNKLTITGSFASPAATTEPVEFRLYGWGAASSLDSTHVTAASMRARFASVVGSAIDPTGELAVQGDFLHLECGLLAIDLGGTQSGSDYDVLDVAGAVELAGDLSVSFAQVDGLPFAPALGDRFEILTASDGVSGEFANVALPDLDEGLDWFIDYDANEVALQVFSAADFNRDGSVDGDDLASWNTGFGQTTNVDKADGDGNNDGIVDGTDFLLWQRHVGDAFVSTPASHSVPEPGSVFLWAAGACAAYFARRHSVRTAVIA
jgi:hypothetical protein